MKTLTKIFLIITVFTLVFVTLNQVEALDLDRKITLKLKRNVAEDTDPPWVDLQEATQPVRGRENTALLLAENYGEYGARDLIYNFCLNKMPQAPVQAGGEIESRFGDFTRVDASDDPCSDGTCVYPYSVPSPRYTGWVCEPADIPDDLTANWPMCEFIPDEGPSLEGDPPGHYEWILDGPPYPPMYWWNYGNAPNEDYWVYRTTNDKDPLTLDDDIDDDGLTDTWEIFYFKQFAGQYVNGISFADYDSNNPLPFLQTVSPDHDMDSDGWWWSYGNGSAEFIGSTYSKANINDYYPSDDSGGADCDDDFEPQDIANHFLGIDPDNCGCPDAIGGIGQIQQEDCDFCHRDFNCIDTPEGRCHAMAYWEPFQFPWQIGTPYAYHIYDPENHGNDTDEGDGHLVPGLFLTGSDYWFTNYEEFVFGTNPLQPDTDGDGFLDEEDVIGHGQQSLKYEIPDDPDLDYLEFQGHTFGQTAEWEKGKNEQRSGFPIRRRADTEKIIKLSTGDPIEVHLFADPEFSKNGDKVTVTTNIENGGNGDQLYYDWYINGDYQIDKSGFGRQSLTFINEENVCDGNAPNKPIEVTADVYKTKDQQLASGKITVPISTNIDFNIRMIGPSVLGAGGELEDPPYVEGRDLWFDYLRNDLGLTGDEYVGHMNDGVRKGDIVEVNASFSETLSNCYDTDRDILYGWDLDGAGEAIVMGDEGERFVPLGDDGDSYRLVTKKNPGNHHLLIFTAYFAGSQEVFARESIRINVTDPDVAIHNVEASGLVVIGTELGAPKYIVPPNTEVTVEMIARFIPARQTGAQDYKYDWRLNNSYTDNDGMGNPNPINLASVLDSFRFTTSDIGSTNSVSLSVLDGIGPAGQERYYGSNEKITFIISDDPDSYVVAKNQTLIGGLTAFISPYYQSIFTIFLIVASLLVLILIFTAIQRNKKKPIDK
ncbi:MAG: hypothetical protein ABIE68_00420 [bacterium]